MGHVNAPADFSRLEPWQVPIPFLSVYSGPTANIHTIKDCAFVSSFTDAVSTGAIAAEDVIAWATSMSVAADFFVKDTVLTHCCVDGCTDQPDGNIEQAADQRDVDTGDGRNTDRCAFTEDTRSCYVAFFEVDKVHLSQQPQDR